jgi:predicted N-formylglutamate amidohydrolase
LGRYDPAPVGWVNAAGRSPFLLTGDHAGNRIPAVLGTLGLSPADRTRHIAIDIGVRGVGEELARRLDAPFVQQIYSRLVIDCNRDPASVEAIPPEVDGSIIPGNAALDADAKDKRIAEIHQPYQQAIGAAIDARVLEGRPCVLIALHSFTPVLAGERRPWDIGILYWQGRTGFATHLLAALGDIPGIRVGDNQPYRMDETDHSVPRHAFARDLAYAEVEIRQDLIGDRAGQARWAGYLAWALGRAISGGGG